MLLRSACDDKVEASAIREDFKKTADWAEEAIPQITLEEGILSIEDDQAFTYTDSDAFFFKVDTTQKSEDEPVIDNFYEIGILITQDEIVLKDEDQVNRLKITDLGFKNINFNCRNLALCFIILF